MNSDVEHSHEYIRVLKSARWKKMKKDRIWAVRFRCEQCGEGGTERTLQLHHKTYERLGQELPEDVVLLCSACHSGADVDRAIDARRRAEDALYYARFNGWYRKKYGSRYQGMADRSDYLAFEDWLDRIEGWD